MLKLSTKGTGFQNQNITSIQQIDHSRSIQVQDRAMFNESHILETYSNLGHFQRCKHCERMTIKLLNVYQLVLHVEQGMKTS